MVGFAEARQTTRLPAREVCARCPAAVTLTVVVMRVLVPTIERIVSLPSSVGPTVGPSGPLVPFVAFVEEPPLLSGRRSSVSVAL